MSDAEDDIEFLDEDADIVQQCVHFQPTIKIELPDEEEEPPAHVIQKANPQISPLLIERPPPTTGRPVTAKKRKKEEDDTDYDPIVDSPYYSNRKRRHNMSKMFNVRKYESSSRSSQSRQSFESPAMYNDSKDKQLVRKPALPRARIDRRDMTIRIPDFDDPLCLPVRALVKDENDLRRLRHWNQLCLEQFKNNDTPLRPRNGPVYSSNRTVVIRNLFNKSSGKTETTFWSKIAVMDKDSDTKIDMVQAVLPRYREKKILTAYKLADMRRRRSVHNRCEVILTKEKSGEEETLVAYNPDTSLSMVFKMFERNPSEAGDGPEEQRRYLEELASCTACTRCYQAAWRSAHSSEEPAAVSCAVCARSFRSAAALLTHLKRHARADVASHRRAIADTLAKLLPYQFRCRVCQQQFPSVRGLWRHLPVHKGVGGLYCEVGNHIVS